MRQFAADRSIAADVLQIAPWRLYARRSVAGRRGMQRSVADNGAMLQMRTICSAMLQCAAIVQAYYSTTVLFLAVQMYYSKNTTFKKYS